MAQQLRAQCNLSVRPSVRPNSPAPRRLLCALLVLGAVGCQRTSAVLSESGSDLDSMVALERSRDEFAGTFVVRASFTLPNAPVLERAACAPSVNKQALRGRLDPAVVLAANEQLNLPMGVGRALSVNGHPYLFCLEPHYHPPNSGFLVDGWHKGVTVYDAAGLLARRDPESDPPM